jgi:hypothetical protein
MAPSIINVSCVLAAVRVEGENEAINNSAQPDSLGSTAIQLSQLTIMIKKTILGASRDEIKKRAPAAELRD